MSITVIVEIGACALGVLGLVGWVVNDAMKAPEEKRPRGYRGGHRGGPVPWKPDVEAPLLPAQSVSEWRRGGEGGNTPDGTGGGNVLEEQLVSWPVGHPEQARSIEATLAPAARIVRPVVVEERTEEMPVVAVPVVHRGADEEWSPAEELPPAAPLDPERTVERRAAGRHRRLTRTVSPERQAERRIAAAQTEMGETLAPLLRRIERAGHADTDTWEWTAAEFEAIRARAGAR